jgi:hypothetical protein
MINRITQANVRLSLPFLLPAIAMPGSRQQMLPINPADLQTALEKDHKQS